LASARTVSSSRDFGVEQFFRADEFRADDPSPFAPTRSHSISLAKSLRCQKTNKRLYNFLDTIRIVSSTSLLNSPHSVLVSIKPETVRHVFL
jgi:hypothetical protein